MMNLIATTWGWIKLALDALTPFKPNRPLSPAVRWAIWILLDLLLLAALYFANDRFDITGAVRLPRFLAEAAWLRHLYLPILGQLLVFIGIVLYWFYLLWFAPADASPFPDIEEAWREGMTALAQAGVKLPEVPLFLLLGRPATSEEHLFQATGLKLVVKMTPANPRAPVHVFADREAVYVTCQGASLLGKLAGILSLEDVLETPPPAATESVEDLDKTQLAGRKEQGIIELLRESAGHEATPSRKRAMRRAALGKPLGSDFLSSPTEIALCKARLAYLCQLIQRDRQPFCAANGFLVMIPLGGTDTPAEAQLTAQALQEDLNVARQETRLDCPLAAMVVDMEELPGFTEFIQRQPLSELGNRRGSGFPMATRLSREETLEQVRISLTWVCTTYLQDSVYRVFATESVGKPDVAPLIAGNTRMMLLLDEMNARADSLVAILQQAVAPTNDTLLRYAGCYLSATGPKGSQAFVAGVLQKLVKEQSSVSWTENALQEDAQSRTWATYYMAASFVLAVLWVLLLIWLFIR